MATEKPLTKARLHEILARFEPGVSMEMVGGYDTGVYFRFKGKATRRILPDDRMIGGRLVHDHGFCSESLMMTRSELLGRGGLKYGIESFLARCEERKTKLERWLAEFQAQHERDIDEENSPRP